MIDIENEVYTRCATAIRSAFPQADVSGIFVNEPSTFPHVSIVMRDCSEWQGSRDSSYREKIVDAMFEVNVYSDRKDTPKSEAKAIMETISDVMRSINFTRTVMTPVENLARGNTSSTNSTGSLFRLFARFEGKATKYTFIG